MLMFLNLISNCCSLSILVLVQSSNPSKPISSSQQYPSPMDLLGPILQVVLFLLGPIHEQFGYLKHLGDKMRTLKSETEELKCIRDEIQADVEAAVSVGKAPARRVENWLEDVENFITEVDLVVADFEQGRTCFGGCCSRHRCRYVLGKKVVKKMKEIEKLKAKGVFDKLAVSPRSQPLQEWQVPPQLEQQSTSKQILEEIWQRLHDGENSILCVCGMGGIGKTTLMKAINNRLIRTDHFGVVMWVTVSKDLNLELIQEKIGYQLHMAFNHDESIENKRHRLFVRLSQMRYLLILDDLWQAFNLDEVGIPRPDKENKCKIVLTTRSIAVSNAMEADHLIKTKTLTTEEAWSLFRNKAGEVVISPEIRPLAQKVVRECCGLPLAIKTVGQSMRGKHRKQLWKNALRALRGSAPEIPGMEPEVFLPLKLSYDCLGDPKIQLCFLYCSQYPEDDEIFIDELVMYWTMEEGLIDNVNNLEEALNKGCDMVERLKDACLLEKGFLGDKYVRMHDLLRDLAIWITSPLSHTSSSSSSHFQAPKYLVKAGEGLVYPPEQERWKCMEKISLMHNNIRDLQITPNCPELVTLFLNGYGQIHTIHAGFFEFMPKLRILDLSDTCITSLPASLALLVNLHALILRFCRHLVDIPPLGQLKELELLDLSETGIVNLPEGITSMTKLKRLDLSHADNLTSIPCNMILELKRLEVLRLMGRAQIGVETLREAASLTKLTSLTVSLSGFDGFTACHVDNQMWSCLRRFNVHVGFKDGIYDDVGRKMIRIYGCENFPPGVELLTKHADFLEFKNCKGPESLSNLVGAMESLKLIEVDGFEGVKCIIDWREVGSKALQYLEELRLGTLPHLENVFNGGAPLQRTHFHRLSQIQVGNCPKLRYLFSSDMVECLHHLVDLTVVDCDEMEEIVRGDILSDNVLPRLNDLLLSNLPRLSTICRQQLIFTSLKYIVIDSCHGLRKLPLLNTSTQELIGCIRGQREWWERIEWGENSNSVYSRIYREPEPEPVEEAVEEASPSFSSQCCW